MKRLKLSTSDVRIFLLGSLFTFLSVLLFCGLAYQWLKWQTRQQFYALLQREAGAITQEIKNAKNTKSIEIILKNHEKYASMPFSLILFDENIKVFCQAGVKKIKVPETFREALLEQGFYEKIALEEQLKGGSFNYNGKRWFWLISGKDENGNAHLHRTLCLFSVLGVVFFLMSSLVLFIILQNKSVLTSSLNSAIIEFMRKKTGDEWDESDTHSVYDVTGNLINVLIKRVEIWQQSQRNFIHFASHELRTPIAILIAQTELAAKNAHNNEEQNSFFKKQLQELGVLSGFIESILLLSNVEKADDPNRSYVTLRVDDLLFRVVAFYQNLFPEKSIHVSFAMIPENEKMLEIEGIESLLFTGLSNLISNAIQYSENEPVEIKIYFSNAKVILEFINDGPLIPESSRELLFTPFFRGANSSGLGIGLSLTKKIIGMHKGTIYYHSDIQQRNVFSVTLA